MINNKTMTTAGAIALIGATTAGIYQHVDAATSTTIYQTTARLNMRVGPGTEFKSLGLIPEGLDIGVVSISNGWAKLDNGNYVCATYIKKSNGIGTSVPTASTQYRYTTEKLNLRRGLGTNHPKITSIPKGVKVKVLYKYSNGWSKVSYNGYTGYCVSQYLSTNKTTTPSKQVFINKIVINKSKRLLYCYSNGVLQKTYSCAIGKPSSPTPSGTFKVINMQKNRPYYKGNIPGGDPRNPLGKRFIQLTKSGVAIHGNNNSSSIGKNVSGGCIRLANANVEWLYDRVAVGKTIVTIY